MYVMEKIRITCIGYKSMGVMAACWTSIGSKVLKYTNLQARCEAIFSSNETDVIIENNKLITYEK